MDIETLLGELEAARTMTDIVKRMRRRNAFVSVMGDPHWTLTADPDPDCQEAAAEIERLRAEVAMLKGE